MYNMMDALRGCREDKFDSCYNLRSSLHAILVIILQSVSLNINRKYIIICIVRMDKLDGAPAFVPGAPVRVTRARITVIIGLFNRFEFRTHAASIWFEN